MKNLVTIAMSLVFAVSVIGQNPPANSCENNDKMKEFDFWIGDWDVFVQGKKVGENLVEKEVNGCTLVENWKNTRGGTGKSLNVYDASVRKWKQFYVGSQGGVLFFEGNRNGDIMSFTSETLDAKGAKVFHILEFHKFADGTVRQLWKQSSDKTKWATVWDSIYRKKGSSTPEEVSFSSKDGISLFADIYISDKGKKAPLVLLFHQGGANVRAEYATHIPRLQKLGYNVIAVDTRAGGSRLGGENRTVSKLEKDFGYCDAYPDLEASLEYARTNGFNGKTVAWGSSFSAALVFQLAAKHSDKLNGILAFSPAAGGPLEQCKPSLFTSQIKVPVFAARPRSEMQNPATQAQFEDFKRLGFKTYIAENGVHGSSMLNPNRVKGDVSDHWQLVEDFLKGVLK